MIEKLNANYNYDKLIEIWKSAVKATHTFLSYADYESIKSNLPNYFSKVNLHIYIDESKNIVGFMGTSADKIEMLFISNESRNKGIGKKMVLFAIQTLNVNKVDVNQQNILALHFYQHLGFEEIGYSETDSEGKNYPIIHLQLF